ncbi:barstar family protein [bacterium]|nr:barstar family protein [bacterium]
MHDRMEILDAVAAALNFPDYFGRNWSALLDCLCDFHWVEQQRIVLVHDELPRVKTEDMLTYLAIVKTSIAAWIEWTTHPADHLLGGIASHTLGVVVGKKEEHEFRKLFKLAR